MSETSLQKPTSMDVRGLSRRMVWRSVILAGLLAAGMGTVYGLENWLNATFDKPPAPLQKELDQMSRQIGLPVRYEAQGSDQLLPDEEVSTLGTTKYLLRDYRDLKRGQDTPCSVMNLNVNYYATGSSTPHVPENCWIANGREQAGPGEVFEVTGVKRADGTEVSLRMNLLLFKPARTMESPDPDAVKNAAGEPLYQAVAYVFHVNGEYVATTREVTSRFWKMENNYAYHAKIEVTPRSLCTREEAKQAIGDFMRLAVAEVEVCLPDPAIVTQGKGRPK